MVEVQTKPTGETKMVFLGSRLVKVLDLGVGENLYGGRLLEMAAEQGAIHAARSKGEGHLVGYRFSEFYLTRPVKAGEVLDFYAEKVRRGRSSVTFFLEARVGGERALRGECTFVAVDADGKKKQLREMEP